MKKIIQSEKSTFWWKGLIIVAVLVIVLVAVILLTSNGVSKIAVQQLNDLKKNDLESAYSLTSKGFQAAVNFDQFKAYVAQNPALSQNDGHYFKSSDEDENNNSVVLTGTLKGGDGKQYQAEYVFVKEDNAWKITSISINPVEQK